MFGAEHEMLLEYAKKRLAEEGYRLIAEDAAVGEGRVDLLASKDGRLVGVECMKQVQPRNLAKRLKGVDIGVFFCVPDEREAERLRKAGFRGEVWVAGFEMGFTTLKVPKATVRKLMSMAKKGEGPRQVIERIVEEKLKEEKRRN